MSEKRTELKDVGKHHLIQELTKKFSLRQSSSLSKIGEDAIVVKTSDTLAQVISQTVLLEGVHFNLMYTPFKHLAYKSVVAAISKIIAMNALPRQIMVTLSVSNRFPKEVLEEFFEGIHKACDIYTLDLAGVELNSSAIGMQINMAATGEAKIDEVIYRHTAQENDLIVVTGDLGAAYMGLQLLEREKEVFKANPSIQPDLEGNDYLLERQLKPEARKDVLGFLKTLEVQPTSMISLTNGLASDIFQICEASNLGCNLFDEKIPIDGQTSISAIDFNIDPITAALNGGDDYELLFTVSLADFDKIKGNPHMTVVGYMVDAQSGRNFIDKNGSVLTLKAQGW